MLQGFTVGQHVVVTIPGGGRPFNATVTRVVASTGRIGGLFNVVPHFAPALPEGADLIAGDWMAAISDDVPDVVRHRDALV